MSAPKRRRAAITVGALLQRARREAGLRQVDLAKKLGVAQSYVSKYESGERRLDLYEVRQICRSLNISLTSVVATFDELQ